MTCSDLATRLLAGVSGLLADVPPVGPTRAPAHMTTHLPLAVAGLAVAGGVLAFLVLAARARRGPGDQA